MRSRTSVLLIRNRMLYVLSDPQISKLRINQVRSLISRFSSSFSPSNGRSSKTHTDISSINCSVIEKNVPLRCPDSLEKVKLRTHVDVSLKHLLLEVSDVIPGIARRLGRVSCLKPRDVLEILLGFEFESRDGIEGLKVESLWGVFKWATEQHVGFEHLPQSCEIMSSLLIRVGMLREVELLLAIMQRQGISLDGGGIFSDLIEGLVDAGEFERALSVFRGMRDIGFAPSLSCYRILISSFVGMKRSQLAFQVCLDMEEMGFGLGDLEKTTFENVVRLLCTEGKIKEARSLVKKVMSMGLKPSRDVLDDIGCGYCEKRDFEDLLSFFYEMEHSPSVQAGNKILHAICSNFGAERAHMFSQELEHLGFIPSNITFGILIGWSCQEGNLKSALFYLSEILSRSLKPDIRSYNSLLSGIFKSGKWKLTRDILNEMKDAKTKPNSSTFRVLLAGYCKFRRFAEAKNIINEMVNHGMIQFSSHDDPLSKAFMILGLSSLDVKVKRDNDVGLPRTEFFDDLGNGLYLDTDLDEYEKRIDQILEDSLVPDFNSLAMKECGNGNLKTVFMLADEMILWGQEPSPFVFSELVKEIGVSCLHVKASSNFQEKMQKLANHEQGMTKKCLVPDNIDYDNLIKQSCSYQRMVEAIDLVNMMLKKGKVPSSSSYDSVISGLCKCNKLEEALDFHTEMMDKHLNPSMNTWGVLINSSCREGLTAEADRLLLCMVRLGETPTKEMFCSVINRYSFENNLKRVSELVQSMQQYGHGPDFKTHWGLIRNLNNPNGEDNDNSANGFLSRLLSKNGKMG